MKFLPATFFLLVCLLLGCCSQSEDEKKLSLIDQFKLIKTEAEMGFKAYANLKEATETIGHRLTGSENGQKAEEFAMRKLKEAGLKDVRFHPFEVTAWQRGTNSFQIVNERPKRPTAVGFWSHLRPKTPYVPVSIPAVTMAHSPVKASVTADIEDAGSGLAANFDLVGEKMKGKIALINLGLDEEDSLMHNLHRTEKAGLALAAGAVGVIFYNSVKGDVLLTGTVSLDGQNISIPAICISNTEGLKIKASLEYGIVTAKIEMNNFSDVIHARNVIARIEGSEFPEETIVLGGHLDSWDLATGAIDNGIGSFTIIEVARIFSALNLKPRRSIEFILFMGEEQGLLGSTSYVDSLKRTNQLDKIVCMINLDMSGNPNGFGTGGRKEMEAFFTSLGDSIRAVDTSFTNKQSKGAGLHSDHQPFMMQGIPTFGVMSNLDRNVYDCYHSDCDDFQLVNSDHMTNCSKYVSMMLWQLANTDSIPSKRFNETEIRDFLISHDLKEKLQIKKEWRWEN